MLAQGDYQQSNTQLKQRKNMSIAEILKSLLGGDRPSDQLVKVTDSDLQQVHTLSPVQVRSFPE